MSVGENTFPLDDVLTAQFARPAELSNVNLRALTPFQRALLVIDGTVTKFIEAYTLEPLEIMRLAQTKRPVSEDQPWLEVSKGTEVVVRQVAIRGKYSHVLYVYAVSLIAAERLPEEFRNRLEVQGEGLGRLFIEAAIETRREILWFGKERLVELPDALQSGGQDEYVSRAYRIITRGKPVALINEKFPYALDGLPSHH